MPSAKLAAFQSRIEKKVSAITYKDVTFPGSSFSPLDAFLKSSAAKTATSNTYRVNVCPDFTPSLLYLINESALHRSDFESVSHPKASALTYLAYQLNIIYCWFILHDLYVSPESIPYAEDIIDHHHLATFLEDVLDYPVPPQVITVLSQWSTSCLELQSHIWFCPSFADHTLATHFGRIFPVTLFLNAHDLIAAASANDKNFLLHDEYAQMPVFTVTAITHDPFGTPTTAARTFTPAHYFALNYRATATSTDVQYLANKINQIIVSYIGFDRIKGQKTKTRFSAVNITPITAANDRLAFNPYLVYTALSSKNVAELKNVYDSVSSVIIEKKLANANLAACFTSVPSSGILNHGYSSFPLPHWDARPANNLDTPTATAALPDPTRMSRTNLPISDYQNAILFKITSFPAASLQHTDNTIGTLTASTTLGNATQRDAITSANTRITFLPSNPLSAFIPLTVRNQRQDILASLPAHSEVDFTDLIQGPAPTTADPTRLNDNPTGTLLEFNDSDDVYPKVKVILPNGPSENAASLTTLRGLIIYSEEFRASIVSHLNSLDQIDDDNSQFLQSAVSFSLTHLAIHFETHTPQPTRVISTPRLTASIQDAVSHVRDATRVYAPSLTLRTFHYGFNSPYYGLTRPSNPTPFPLFAQTFFGQTIATRTPTARQGRAHRADNSPTGTLLLWSPYTYRSQSANLDSDSTLADILHSTYFLSNLRTLFGSQLTVYECLSPIYAMPTNA